MNANVLDSPLELQKFLCSLLSDVAQVLRWRGQRNTLRESSYQAARRALSRTLHFNVSPLLLLELLSGFDHSCPSVTAFPSARRLPGCQGTSTKSTGFSLLNTSISLCYTKKTPKIQTLSSLPIIFLLPCLVLSQLELCFFGFLRFFCQEGRDTVAGISTCLGILQRCVAA